MAGELAILHVDLDAFYASVEQLADPSLRGRPVVVGGLGPRGVVAAASYEARRFGVHSAMPMVRARRACPDAVFLAPRFDAYEDASRAVMTILRTFTPLVEPIALDEAFLDVHAVRRLHGPGPEVAVAIRRRVRDETGLTASVGVAGTKQLAKLASDLAKPDGLLVVEAGRELEFLHPLPVERLWGVGPATRRRLARLGVRTVGDLAAVPVDKLVREVGRSHGEHLHALAWNRDERRVEPERRVKSVGHEETFPTDVVDRAELEREVVRLADKVASRLRRAGCSARTVQLKLRYPDFRTITRSRTLPDATDLASDLAHVAGSLLAQVDIGPGVRLLGVAAQQLEQAETVQDPLPLSGEPAGGPDAGATEPGRRAALERSVDRVRARYGDGALLPARLARSQDPTAMTGNVAPAESGTESSHPPAGGEPDAR
ncbi:MAG TPA: DNA polymerase IV [Acidimicrobiia bacterium]|nr:DNA polymerase IV [Acidimicrobiia bacterium]